MDTTYHFNKEDYKFICELAKVGYVKLFSSQVSMIAKNAINFTEKFKNGANLPDNWSIEYVGFREEKYSQITFHVAEKILPPLIRPASEK